MAIRQHQQIPPLTRAHQEALRASVARLRAAGEDAGVLEQLAEALPLLRASLGLEERRRIDELDANEEALGRALDAASGVLSDFAESHARGREALLDPAGLRGLAEVARQLSEVAGEIALRAAARAGLLE